LDEVQRKKRHLEVFQERMERERYEVLMYDVRCKRCHKLLFKTENIDNNPIEIKCPKCGYINRYWFDNDYSHPLDE